MLISAEPARQSFKNFYFILAVLGADEMAQHVKGLVPKAGDTGSISRTYVVGGK